MRHFTYCLLLSCLLVACTTTETKSTSEVITTAAMQDAKTVVDTETSSFIKKEEAEISHLEHVVNIAKETEDKAASDLTKTLIPPELAMAMPPIPPPKMSAVPPPVGYVSASGNPAYTVSAGSVSGGGTLILTRSYVYPGDKFSTPPVNLILFPHKPVSKDEIETYKDICEIYKSYFPDNDEVVAQYASDSSITTLPIVWMLKKHTDGSCEQLVANYDYTRAQIYIDTNRLDIAKIQIVCHWKTATMIMDISSVEKSEDLQLAFDMWKKKMCHIPDKDTRVNAYDLYSSAKEVLGAIGKLMAFK